VDDPQATPGDLEALASADEQAWQDGRHRFLHYP
jgi:hypothetical protein